MEQGLIKNLFEEKYRKLLDQNFEEWWGHAPQTEAEAYTRLQEIDDEIKGTEAEWREANGEEKDFLQDYREKLRGEYQLLEEAFGLEPLDAEW